MSTPGIQSQASPQVGGPAPAPGPAPTQSAPGTSVRPASRASMLITGRGSATTPRRLRLARLALTVLSGVLAAGAVVTSAVLADRQAQAEVHATQYVRAGTIESDLLRAHAATANSLLQKSSEPAAAQQAVARQATDDAAWSLVQISAAGVDDLQTLAGISQGMLRYTETLAQVQQQRGSDAVRTTLSQAYTQLNDELLPKVQALQQSHLAVSTSGVPWWMWLLPVLAWVTAAGTLAASWYAARTSHRVVNAGLAAALVLTGALAIYSGNLLTSADDGGIGDQFSRLSALATARQSATAADALLDNAVVTRGWQAADADTVSGLLDRAGQALGESADSDLQPDAEAVRVAANAVAGLAGKGDWTAAETAVTATGEDSLEGTVAALLDRLSARGTEALSDVQATVNRQADNIVAFGVVAALCALGAGLAAIAGLHQRLKEYR